jgi:hypothetical protein
MEPLTLKQKLLNFLLKVNAFNTKDEAEIFKAKATNF